MRSVIRILTHIVCGLVLGSLWSVASAAAGQPAGRRVATLQALAAHPIFFHGKEVLVRAEAESEQTLTYLVDDQHRLLALDVTPPIEGTRDRLEILGTFYDVGRLDPTDQRLAGYPFDRLAERFFNKPWPGAGDLPVIIAASSRPATELRETTLRTLALEPEKHIDHGVTVTGRFRGRNLYGDLPKAPGQSRWDFVLVSAEAAIWVVGKEPKGDDFELDVLARVDTGRWLEVTGNMRYEMGMVLLEAGAIRLAEPSADAKSSVRAPLETRQGSPPEVIFSAPLQNDADVPRDMLVRLQFSRDMDPLSFEGHVTVTYAGNRSVECGQPYDHSAAFQLVYQPRNRVLEIRFESELERFRLLNVELFDGITATDGARLAPWTLSFLTGA